MKVLNGNRNRRSSSLLMKGIWLLIIFILSISLISILTFTYRPSVDEVMMLSGGPPSRKAWFQTQPANQDSIIETSQKRRTRALSDAANSLRCLTIPGCYPTIRCSDGAEPMKIPVSRTYEQQSFCTGDLAAQAKESKCLVYSFGINDNTEWEEKIAKQFGCDVFAFDPTSSFKQDVAPGVTFYQLGLQGAGVDVSKTHSVSYDALDPKKLKTLGEIFKLMGHEGRKLDILRLDCEGCEWGVLKQLACSGESQLVKQLMVEMHFQSNLGLSSEDDVLVAADAITCLESERWAIASLEKSGCGPKDAQYTQSALKFMRDPYMLLYTTMKRLPEDARWSWDIHGDYIQEDSVQLAFFAQHYGRYGQDASKWPENLKNKYDELGKKKGDIQNMYRSLYGEFWRPEYKTYQLFPIQQD